MRRSFDSLRSLRMTSLGFRITLFVLNKSDNHIKQIYTIQKGVLFIFWKKDIVLIVCVIAAVLPLVTIPITRRKKA